MTGADVQVVLTTPRPGAYLVSANDCHDELRTLDWHVSFFKQLGARDGAWADMSGHRFAAATCWRIRPAAQTVAAVIDELKVQAARCGYARLEVFEVRPPRVARRNRQPLSQGDCDDPA